jgi:hypothetical protein
MSKKSRKRNRKILKALAVGLGAAALMKGRGTPAANVDSGRGGDSASAAARVAANTPSASVVTGTEYPGANKYVAPKKSISFSKRSNRGIGDYGVVTAPKRVNNILIKGRNNAEMGRNIPFDPSQGNLYKPKFTMQGDSRGYGLKKGGRVKGCGIAKRGLGRAMKKGRK